MENNWMVLMQQKNQIAKVMEAGQAGIGYGLSLSEEEAKLIVEARTHALGQERRVEFGEGIATRIIYEFCDSDFISQDDYALTIIRLQDIFYLYKNETQDELTDEELLHFMKEQFETVCFGDLDYLEGTCLNIFSQAVRAGYEGYKSSGGRGEYGKFDEVKRWDYELYLEALRELCWR